jgi:hypothetical protein
MSELGISSRILKLNYESQAAERETEGLRFFKRAWFPRPGALFYFGLAGGSLPGEDVVQKSNTRCTMKAQTKFNKENTQ